MSPHENPHPQTSSVKSATDAAAGSQKGNRWILQGEPAVARAMSPFGPTLPKPAVAIGKFAAVPGIYWISCPAADKEKRYLCTVIEFNPKGGDPFGMAIMISGVWLSH